MKPDYTPPSKRALAELHRTLAEQTATINDQDAEIQRLNRELEAVHRLAAAGDPAGYYLLMAELAEEDT